MLLNALDERLFGAATRSIKRSAATAIQAEENGEPMTSRLKRAEVRLRTAPRCDGVPGGCISDFFAAETLMCPSFALCASSQCFTLRPDNRPAIYTSMVGFRLATLSGHQFKSALAGNA